MTVRGL